MIIQRFGKNNEQNQTKMNNNEQSEQNQTKSNNNEQNSEQFISVLIDQIKEKDETDKEVRNVVRTPTSKLTLNDKKVIEKQEKKIELLTVNDEQNKTKMNNNEQYQTKHHFWDIFKK
ncbi:hypothetical protein AKUH4B501J_UNKNOWN200110 (plasmid) [Apilactobacillus kunkeei]|nr:hypothetical protein AKUH4B501J_UNKNOWN200110 [Apilactobacillus kunkeei]